MAEALARQLFPDSVKVGSAGINPLGFIADETLAVLEEIGIATEGLWSKGLTEINCSEFPVLVNLSSHTLDSSLPRDFQGRIISHPVIDPFGGNLALYREARDAIRRLVTEYLPPLLLND